MTTSNINYLIFSIIFFISTTSICAFNITYFLEQHKEFSKFNDLLSQTGVAAGINKQGTVTVLVLDNSAVGPLEGEPKDTIGNVLATHVLLDYYDKTKLDNLEGKSAKGTNLYQETGKANGAQGLLNISNSRGQVTFASSVKGAPRDTKMVKVVSSQPFHISVIQVSMPIITPGLNQVGPTPPSPSPKVVPPMAAQSPRKAKGTTPAPAPAPNDEEEADGPTADTEGPAPASEPTSGSAPSPAPQGDEADKEAPVKMTPHKNSGTRLTIRDGGVLVATFIGLITLSTTIVC